MRWQLSFMAGGLFGMGFWLAIIVWPFGRPCPTPEACDCAPCEAEAVKVESRAHQWCYRAPCPDLSALDICQSQFARLDEMARRCIDSLTLIRGVK